MLSIETSRSLVRYRFSFWELVPVAILIAVYYLLPYQLTFATAVIVTAIFALSLDLVIGFAGIVTLGHSIFFGIGAFAAGRLALAGWQEPISVVLISALTAAFVAALTGPLILRLKGLPLIMVTIGLAAVVYEAGNKMPWLTGGHDGLPALRFDPILGTFRWSIFGTRAMSTRRSGWWWSSY
jgi:ABC-type branched-chain amino acid transport system, permease component